ncbi:hypothetical protein [Micromonospora carbonacea]|uniref:hypothetical protein n=1 Tax=Micromonospora carbonacea TaxID=47853 RepID=UPI00371C35F2
MDTTRVIGTAPAPAGSRMDDTDTVGFAATGQPTLTQQKIDDRGPRIPKQRGGQPAEQPAEGEELAGMLLSIDAALTNPHVLPAVRDNMWATLRRLAGDASTANLLARTQQVIDNPSLSRTERIAGVVAAFQCPDWCSECITDGERRLHKGLVGEFTDNLNPKFPTTLTVWVVRTDEQGKPGKAFVFVLGGSDCELTAEGSLRLGELHVKAARIALRDNAEQATR